MPFPSSKVVPPYWSSHHRPVAAGGMNAVCELQAPTGDSVYDPTTGSSSTDYGPAEWSGECRIQVDKGTIEAADQAGQQVTSRGYLVQLDETASPVPVQVAPGWLVKIADAPNDLALTGRTLTVTDVQYGSERFTRDLFCDDNLG